MMQIDGRRLGEKTIQDTTRKDGLAMSSPLNPHDPGPAIIFEFKYRPREFLQAQGVIPLVSPDGATSSSSNSAVHVSSQRQTPKMNKRSHSIIKPDEDEGMTGSRRADMLEAIRRLEEQQTDIQRRLEHLRGRIVKSEIKVETGIGTGDSDMFASNDDGVIDLTLD